MVSWLLVIAEMPLAPLATSSTSLPASSMVPNSLSTRMNDHRSSSNNPDNLSLQVAIHTKSHQLPFNSCWNVRVLHNLTPNTNHIIRHHLELAYQFFLSSRHTPGINLHSIFPPLLSPSCLAPILVTLFQIYHVMPSLPCAHKHLLSSDRERHMWSSKHFT